MTNLSTPITPLGLPNPRSRGGGASHATTTVFYLAERQTLAVSVGPRICDFQTLFEMGISNVLKKMCAKYDHHRTIIFFYRKHFLKKKNLFLWPDTGRSVSGQSAA